jgi:phosphopantothenoylcysteine decarboxylase/phosphopantothenate--cysteine ligase
MGFAIAQTAAEAGAKVILVAGPVNLPTPKNVERIDVRSARQMFDAVQKQYAMADCFIGAAAVADFRPEHLQDQKIKKQTDSERMTIELVKNPDIIAWVAQQDNKPFVVGFAAETENVLDYARSKLKSKRLDMICANQVGENQGFERDDNSLTIITDQDQQTLPISSKFQQAFSLLKAISKKYT